MMDKKKKKKKLKTMCDLIYKGLGKKLPKKRCRLY